MIVSFLDKNFKGLQNNASLSVAKGSYSLVKRPVELDEFKCTCEPFTENIQPTFIVVRDNIGGRNIVYSCLAGIPLLNDKNQTEINGTDLKSMLSSDVILTPSTYTYVYQYIDYVFNQWLSQVNQSSFTVELNYKDYTGTAIGSVQSITMGSLLPSTEKAVYNAWEEIQAYLKFYNLYMEGAVDQVNKKVVFTIGRTMASNVNVKLWEYGIKNYGKHIASVNECQGYYKDSGGNLTAGYKWIMTSSGDITTTEANRDVYPIKRKVFISEESVYKANVDALTSLLENRYQENIDLPLQNEVSTYSYQEYIDIQLKNRVPTFETKFSVYVNKGDALYKELPCGELRYDENGLIKCQIGYRFTGAMFI